MRFLIFFRVSLNFILFYFNPNKAGLLEVSFFWGVFFKLFFRESYREWSSGLRRYIKNRKTVDESWPWGSQIGD